MHRESTPMPRESIDHVFHVPVAGLPLAGDAASAIHELGPLVR